MTQNNNLSVLPFYASLEEQSRKRSYAYGDIYPLYTPLGKIPPFQIVIPYGTGISVTSATLKRADGVTVGSLTLTGIDIKLYQANQYDVVVYDGGTDAGAPAAEGQYYIELVLASRTYYSDVFTAVGDISPYLKIEWWDDEDLQMEGGRIVYYLGTGSYFKNRLYLNTQLGKPEYEFEDEGEKRDGLFFPEKMISEKTYKFSFLANEQLCDVMRFIRMADHVKITDRYGNVYECDTFLMTPKWETQGNLASVEVEFQTAVVAKRVGRSFTS